MGYLQSSAFVLVTLSGALISLPAQANAVLSQPSAEPLASPNAAAAQPGLPASADEARRVLPQPASLKPANASKSAQGFTLATPQPRFSAAAQPAAPVTTRLALSSPSRVESVQPTMTVAQSVAQSTELPASEPTTEPAAAAQSTELPASEPTTEPAAIAQSTESPVSEPMTEPAAVAQSTEPSADPAGEAADPGVPAEAGSTPESMPESMMEPAPTTTADDLPAELIANPDPLALPQVPEEVQIDLTQPIELQEAIALAYRNSQDLQAAQLELQRSQAALQEAQAALYPNVDIGADISGQNTTLTSLGVPIGERVNWPLNAFVDVNYDLYTMGQRQATIRAAEEQVRFSELEVKRRQEQLRLDTANLYYTLQQAREGIRINQAFLDEASENLRTSRIRQQEGVGTQFDVLRAEVQFANARQNLIQSQSDEKVAQRDLARLLNLPPMVAVQSTPVKLQGEWPLSLDDSIITAFENRPELDQALAQKAISEQQAIAARTANGPRVSLFGNYTQQNVVNQDLGWLDDYSFGARVSMRVFDGGAARARARQQQRNADIAAQQFSQTVDQVRFDVEQAYYNLQANQENITTAEVAVGQAKEALRLANLRFDAGVGTQLDVLQAQSEVTQAEVNYVQAVLGYNRSIVALQRAVSNLEGASEN